MITEKDISKKIGRLIQSPIRIGNIEDLGIDYVVFFEAFGSWFDNLEADEYLVRKNQLEYLQSVLEHESHAITELYKTYFEQGQSTTALSPFLNQLSKAQLKEFTCVSNATRYRSIAEFSVVFNDSTISIKRNENEVYTQAVRDSRSWKRKFNQKCTHQTENPLFKKLIEKFASITKEIHPEIKELRFVAHSMRIYSNGLVPAENSPEGIHEDGANYIVSALVVNRTNCSGAESQIYECVEGSKELIYTHELQPGEFIFQADTGEEKTFGNDLWHHVTAMRPLDENVPGIRDIIGFDIDIIH